MRLSFRDPRVRGWVWQGLVVAAAAMILWVLAGNTHRNLAARHIATGFGFLHQSASIPIAGAMIPYTASVSTYGRALLIGILNTLRVAVAGIVLATALGTVIGIGRLSHNWLIAKVTAAYVEVIRDIPLLLQLFFLYGLLQVLPPPRQALHPLPDVFLTNRGLFLPGVAWHGTGWIVLAALVAACAATWVASRLASRHQRATGRAWPVWPFGAALILGAPPLLAMVLGARPDTPALHGFGFHGGLELSPEYTALLGGLVIYTASYIAEIVRSGIQAVARGQWEAAGALGLSRAATLRHVVLPQAMRVIVPPMTSQFLNLTKNSSLAVAIGYQDIVSIAGTTLNQTGQAIEGVGIIMAVFLVISLGISLFMNAYNARIALVER